MRLEISRTTFRVKIVVLFLFVLGLGLILADQSFRETRGQVRSPQGATEEVTITVPADVLIDDFDKTIQQRFLTAPSFGIRRIEPRVPPLENPHFQYFTPNTEAERSAVNAFDLNGWDVGIFLYGRKVTRRTDTKKEKYNIRYRIFDPIPVTGELKKSDFSSPKDLAEEIKQAFVDFQKPGSPNENEVRLEGGRWSYVARPVRAATRSCIVCHKDYVITERLGDGKFTARPRKIGDANGVLVYAFRRRDPQP